MTIGEVAGRMINKRARLLFLLVLFFTLMIVIGIFGLVIALIFSFYPESVLSVWIAMPLAVVAGIWIHRASGNILIPTFAALAILYGAVAVGVYYLPVNLGELLDIPLVAKGDVGFFEGLASAAVIWTGVLLIYCFIASVLPVWLLLQPRDYINSFQLYVALILLVAGLLWAHPPMVAPAVQRTEVHDARLHEPTPEGLATLAASGIVTPKSPLSESGQFRATAAELAGLDAAGVTYTLSGSTWNFGPKDAPPMLPFLFITIACGAISGFHSLVSSGTTSKQLKVETDAHYVGYGSMLMEGALATLVILACCAGLGMGKGGLVGEEAWRSVYHGSWGTMTGLGPTVGAFVEGAANMIAALGIPVKLAVGIVAVMVACFAATTLDTATRLQRYIIQELGTTLRVPALTNKYAATTVAVVTGGALALIPSAAGGPGTGGMILWPLFGTVNQLLAGLAFMVVAFYLVRHSKPVWFLVVPLALMVVLPAWALTLQLQDFWAERNYLLVGLGGLVFALQGWMLVEGALMWRGARGTLPEPLPPLRPAHPPADITPGRAAG
jgi:carbon starvation protein